MRQRASCPCYRCVCCRFGDKALCKMLGLWRASVGLSPSPSPGVTRSAIVGLSEPKIK